MRKTILNFAAMLVACFASFATMKADTPSDGYLLVLKNDNGLSLAYSPTGKSWKHIADRCHVVKSDFGAWGREKKLYDPSVAMLSDSTFVAVWGLNDRVNQFAICTTPDFISWHPQDYPYMEGVEGCFDPTVEALGEKGCKVTFTSKDGKTYITTSPDCVHFSAPEPADKAAKPKYTTVEIDGLEQTGTMLKMPLRRIKQIADHYTAKSAHDARYGELAKDNAKRFKDIDHLNVAVKIDNSDSLKISDKLMGIFFEDINYSADGGLYAELVQNRDFEYSEADEGRHEPWGPLTCWTVDGTAEIKTENPIHQNNSHYAALAKGTKMTNSGYEGITLKKGDKYDLSLFVRGAAVEVKLVDGDKTLASARLGGSKNWKQVKTVLTPKADAQNAAVEVTALGDTDIDFVSLFPQRTFKGRKNGMRADLAQALADIHPKFMRFPGGCVAHGNGLDNMYRWKQSIGPLHERKQDFNLWGYHQSRGIGYYEYFQFCEDLGMEPLPVLPAGVCCQNTSRGGDGQMGGLPMGEEMDEYIQDVLDLIEWANGDPKTSTWAKMRADAGHPKPFGLKMIGIGNEDLISHAFKERFIAINNAIKARYPEIEVCGTAGPFYEGSDYEEGWKLANQEGIALIDEHYYASPGWYVWNHDYYDDYDRGHTRVYLGEYAAHGPGKPSNIESALCEALHYCSIERNGDVVAMTSYAPLLAKKGFTQWNPDMIYFTNTEVHPTTTYWAQFMNGQNCGDYYLATSIMPEFDFGDAASPSLSHVQRQIRQRLEASTVYNSATGKKYVKIVNITGIPASVNIASSDNGDYGRPLRTITLSGDWDDRSSKPQESQITLTEGQPIEVEPYSFTILEF